jgi:LacI family transcriptional regulator
MATSGLVPRKRLGYGKNMSITLREVAELAGVSPATASMALREHPRISAATRLRVQEAARQLGYVRDPALSALVARRRRRPTDLPKAGLTLFVAPHLNRRRVPDWWRDLHQGIDQTAEELGYGRPTLVSNAAAAEQGLHERNTLGILLGPDLPVGLRQTVDWRRYGVLAIGDGDPEWRPHRVNLDIPAMVATALRQIQERGLRRILYLGRRQFEQHMHGRWWAALHGSALLLPDDCQLGCRFWDDLDQDPITTATEAVLFSDRRIWPPLRRWLRAQHPAVTPFALNATADMRDISGIRTRYQDLGALAVKRLHSSLLQGDRGLSDYPENTSIAFPWRDCQ